MSSNRIDGVMVSMLASSAVDPCCTIVVTLYVMLKNDGKLHVFAFMEGLPRYKYISIGFILTEIEICYSSDKQAALCRKSKDW
jgi:hypothetical protein